MQITNKTSLLESHHAVFSPSALIGCSAFTNYAWGDLSEQESPIKMEEVEQAIKDNRLTPPGEFVDHPEGEQRCNINDCSRDQHIQRIAWFVQNFDEDNPDVPCLGFSSIDASDPSSSVMAGNHRLCAMIYKGTPSHTFELLSGRKSIIESHPAFIRWKTDIDHDMPFGKNIISSGEASFSIQISENPIPSDYRIWIHNNDGIHDPVTVARFRHSFGGFSSAEMHDYEGKSLFSKVSYPDQETISLREFFERCSDWVHPVFSEESIYTKTSGHIAEQNCNAVEEA